MKKEFMVVSLISVLCFISTGNVFAKSAEPANVQKTEVVIIGTIHDKHYSNPEYSPYVLRDIILKLKPDAILNELPLSLVEPNESSKKDVNELSYLKVISPDKLKEDLDFLFKTIE